MSCLEVIGGTILAGAIIAILVLAAMQPSEMQLRNCTKTGKTRSESSIVVLPNGSGGTYVLPSTFTKYEYNCPDNNELVWR